LRRKRERGYKEKEREKHREIWGERGEIVATTTMYNNRKMFNIRDKKLS
jgi:hypothetical protein